MKSFGIALDRDTQVPAQVNTNRNALIFSLPDRLTTAVKSEPIVSMRENAYDETTCGRESE
jgi:hypothetical protein